MMDLAGELRGRDADVLIEVASEMGITWEQLSEHTSQHGLPWRPCSLRTGPDFVQLLANAQRLGGSRGLALLWGRRVGLHALGSFGLAVMSAATIGEAATYFLDLHRLLQTPFRLEHEVVGDEVHMRTVYQPALKAQRPFTFHGDCLAAICVTALSTLLGRPARALRYLTSAPSCDDRGLYLSSLCDELVQQADVDCTLVYPSAILLEPIVSRNRTVELEHRRVVEAALREREVACVQGDLRARVHRILADRLSDPPPLDQLAKGLGLSERSLRWQLEQASLSYRGLLDGLRCERAQRLLREGRTVRQVCASLGYSDAANFRKAFRRWTAQAPSVWREETDLGSEPG